MTALRGELKYDEVMAAHVSWRAGGRAARAYFPADAADLQIFLQGLPPQEPLLLVGLGSNLLVRDGGFPGTAIMLHGRLKALHLENDGSIFAEAGVASPKLARFAATENLVGAEFLAGIPGTIGGALAMNAGCYGAETWQYVERVLVLDRQGKQREMQPQEFAVEYRHVGLPGGRTLDDGGIIFVGAWFRFPAGDGAAARERIRTLLEQRIASQPLQFPNAGSVFRNPPGDHAARLIEATGLKGASLGGARVSEKHANFIVNPQGKASASEIEMLIAQIRAKVQEKFDIVLHCEVHIVGEKS